MAFLIAIHNQFHGIDDNVTWTLINYYYPEKVKYTEDKLHPNYGKCPKIVDRKFPVGGYFLLLFRFGSCGIEVVPYRWQGRIQFNVKKNG